METWGNCLVEKALEQMLRMKKAHESLFVGLDESFWSFD